MNIYELQDVVYNYDGILATTRKREALDEHKRDNFMRALEALKDDLALFEMIVETVLQTSLSINGEDILVQRRALIAELEEVKC